MGGCNEKKDFINEVKENLSESISTEKMEQVLFMMRNCICKIKLKNGEIGTGFFCKIPFPDLFNLLPVLVTCNHVLNKNSIAFGNKINITLNNQDSVIYPIILDKNRRIFTDEDKDVTIIEIRPEYDKIKYESFLDIDDTFYRNEPLEIYNNKSVCIIHYENGENAKCSIGKLGNIDNDSYTIKHQCKTSKGSSGSPIINLSNFKVIGIHKGSQDQYNINLGTLIITPINEFKFQNKLIPASIQKNYSNNPMSLNNSNPLQNSYNSYFGQKFNNIIYYNENKNNLNSLNQMCNIIEKNLNGSFILCNKIESLKLLKEEIIDENKKDDRIIFNIITTGNACEKVIKFLKKNPNFDNCIKKIFIYTYDLKRYSQLKNENNKIYNISNNYQDVIKFIQLLSSTEIKPLHIIKIITYEDYMNKYKLRHFKVAQYYGDLSPKSFEDNIKKMKLLIDEDGRMNELRNINKNSLLKGFQTFNIKKDLNDLDKLIIREYISNIFYNDLNRWLRNPKDNYFDVIAYFTSRLMYSLNTYAIRYGMFCYEDRKILYRGLILSYSSLLQYERVKGKIIMTPSFISTNENYNLADKLSKYKGYLKFCVILIIINNHKPNWVSNAINVQLASEYNEREFIFLPFTFFYVIDVQIDIRNFNAKIYLETIGKKEILENQIKNGKQIEFNINELIMKVKN